MGKIRHTESIPEEIYDFISKRIDEDIEKLERHEELDYGNKPVPLFEEKSIYTNLMRRIHHKPNIVTMRVLRWACAIALLVGLSYYTYYSSYQAKPIYHEIYASRGEKLVVILSDGSRIWLNADSRLKYPERFMGDTRRVYLSGEAYFEVSKDKSNPFVVESGDVFVRVTGTKFDVKNYSNDSKIAVTLDEGSVSVGRSKQQNNQNDMKPGQTALFDKKSAMCKIYDDKFHHEASIWKSNELAFRNNSIDEVLCMLSRRYDVEFAVKNPEIREYTYNIKCNAGDLGDVLQLMETITPVKFKKTSNKHYEVN